jgi:hypothetical protein
MQKESIFFNQKGTTAVEFAIVLSLLIALIFGIIEFGLFMFNRQVITNAAREGARAGIIARPVRLLNNEIAAVVVDYAEKHLITFGDDVLTVDGTVDTVDGTVDDVDIDEIDYDLSDGLAIDHRCVVFEFEDGGVKYPCELEVTVNYTYEFLFLFNLLEIGPINLQATSVMRME